ncbi:MAG: L-arabinose isomerase [Chitinophagaceae bacterium]
MLDLKKEEVWLVTGSQHLYGEETLNQVAAHAQEIARTLDHSPQIPVKIQFKPVVKTAEEIDQICQQANGDENCIGLLTWMHTFSPAKMWIGGLKRLQKPFLHLHTQFNRDIPWDSIDMDFMNLNQSAHGDREFGFITSRMRLNNKVVVGYWQDPLVQDQISTWSRAASGWKDWQGAKFVRFGDNMRQVAVTEGDKVEAQLRFGYSVNTHGIGDLVNRMKDVTSQQIDDLCSEYASAYELAEPLKKGHPKHPALREAARMECGLRQFLQQGNFKGFTDTFEDLHGLEQLPGIAAQRLMAEGYGFAAEGDWKTAALVRAMKVMGSGLKGGNGFMEDYTYHFEPQNEMVLGSHMLEVCPSLASGKPTCEIHPLGIGGKSDPVRLVFSTGSGPALNASIIDLGNRFRLLVHLVEAVHPPHPLPRLPVARVLWRPLPDMNIGAAAWIHAGGSHHTCFSQNLTAAHLLDFAHMAGMECIIIDKNTNLQALQNELRWNEVYYQMNPL